MVDCIRWSVIKHAFYVESVSVECSFKPSELQRVRNYYFCTNTCDLYPRMLNISMYHPLHTFCPLLIYLIHSFTTQWYIALSVAYINPPPVLFPTTICFPPRPIYLTSVLTMSLRRYIICRLIYKRVFPHEFSYLISPSHLFCYLHIHY